MALLAILGLCGAARGEVYGPAVPERTRGVVAGDTPGPAASREAPFIGPAREPERRPYTEKPRLPAGMGAVGPRTLGGFPLRDAEGRDPVFIGPRTDKPAPPEGESIRPTPPGDRSAWDRVFGTLVNPDPLLPELDGVNDAARLAGTANAYSDALRFASSNQLPNKVPLGGFLSAARWYNRGARVVNAFWQRGFQSGLMTFATEGIKFGASNAIRAFYARLWFGPALAFLGAAATPYVTVPAYLLVLYITYQTDADAGTAIDEALIPASPADPNGGYRRPPPRPTGAPIAGPSSGPRTSPTTPAAGCTPGCSAP